jgi:hypothetical protein
MPCDERYRAWAMRAGAQMAELSPELDPAILVRVTLCPARQGYRELHFDVAGTTWSWCFPGPAGAVRTGVRTVVLRPGPHGLVAQAVAGGGDAAGQPATLDLALAADMAISGVPVVIHRSLARRARHH